MILWLDLETYSEANLQQVGTHVYAEDPTTEIIIAQWAIDDGEPVVVDIRTPAAFGALWGYLTNPAVTVIAHNSAFDRTLLRHCWGINVPIHRWQDTMIKAMAHGLPGSLDRIGQILGVADDETKDKRGRQLIQLFCKPRPANNTLRRATWETHPAEWDEFLEYSRQDIIAMRAIDQKLPAWNYRTGHPELALWHLDQRINDRGVAVDLELALAAIRAVEVEQQRLKAEVQEATNGAVSNVSRRDALLEHICNEYGVELPDLRADTLRRRVEDPTLPEGVRQLLAMRLEATKTSTAKYKALLAASSEDGRLRNTLQFAGAQRTARWAGRIFQPQNLPRPTPDFDDEAQELGIQALKIGCADLVTDNVMQLTSNCLRGCIIAPKGKKLVISDLSNIEGRGLAFLAGERWKLHAFREFDDGIGEDLYKVAYARSFNVDPRAVTKPQRQIGKVMELGLGYEGGVAAFLTFAAVYQMDLVELSEAVYRTAPQDALTDAQGVWGWAKSQDRTLGLEERVYVACEVLKRAWREAHSATRSLWASAGESVRAAIANPGQTFPIGQHLKARRDGKWLRIRLPSGRYLCYIDPQVDDENNITYFGMNQYSRKWERLKTYGGKLIENATQAFARDVLAYNMPAIEQAGYEIVLSVHDELLTETRDSRTFNVQTLSKMMATAPSWAKGLPLAAAGFEAYRYRKD